SEQTSLSHPQVADLWKAVCQTCDMGMSTLTTLVTSRLPGQQERLRRLMGERVKRISVKPFMDIETMVEERLAQCCVHVGTAGTKGDQCAPFCAVQAWAPLSRQKVSSRAPATAGPVPLPTPAVSGGAGAPGPAR